MEPVLAALVVGAVLLGMWWGASRRHAVRRESHSGEWEGSQDRPELWTSSARCPSCGASGGVLDMSDGELWFTCMRCRQRHRREHKA